MVLHGLCVVSLIMFLVIIVSQHCVHDLCSCYVLSCYVLSCAVYKSLIRRGSRETQQNQVTSVVSSSLQSIATQIATPDHPQQSPSLCSCYHRHTSASDGLLLVSSSPWCKLPLDVCVPFAPPLGSPECTHSQGHSVPSTCVLTALVIIQRSTGMV